MIDTMLAVWYRECGGIRFQQGATTENTTLIDLIRARTSDLRKRGYKTTQAKVKEAIAQAYGYRCYNSMYYDRGGRVPTTAFIEATFWRVVGYPEGNA